jgi:hypothetical protein
VHPSRGSGALTFRDVTFRDWVTIAVRPPLAAYHMNRRTQLIILSFAFALIAGSIYVVRDYDGMPWTYTTRKTQFEMLRKDAWSIAEGMSFTTVTETLGVPDFEEKWLSHLPTWRVYYFDICRAERLGHRPRCYIVVLIDSETGVRTVDVYDPIFESCTGHKIENTCTPINRKHHDRFAGPVIIGA